MGRMVTASAIILVTTIGVFAQSAEQDVRKAHDALLAAAEAGDKATYAKFAADDLRWLNADGMIQSKAQRIAGLGGGGTPKFSEIDIKVYGDTAVMLARADFPDGRKQRTHRVFVKRGGQWQLVSHSATPSK